jgi:hypothetical protein
VRVVNSGSGGGWLGDGVMKEEVASLSAPKFWGLFRKMAGFAPA